MIMQRLKQATQSDHQQLEVVMDLPRRLHSSEAYRTMLAHFYGFYAPLEAHLALEAGLRGVVDDLDARWKTALITSDLATLGLTARDLAALPHCTRLPHLSGVAQALGCLYVLEGATLGGQLIRRQLEAKLALTADHGAAFYAGYGAATGPMWRRFGEHVTAYATTPERETLLVAGASTTFMALRHWFEQEVC